MQKDNFDDDLWDLESTYLDDISYKRNKNSDVSHMEKGILRDIKRAGKVYNGAQNLLAAMADPELYSKCAHNLAIDAEYLARNLRQFVYNTTLISDEEYMLDAANAIGISVSQDEHGTVSITIPALLPKRRQRGANFITRPLFEVLQTFIKTNHFTRFGKCVLCFNHLYDRKLDSRNRVRDHDNLELKDIVDVINFFLLTDDTGVLCDFFHHSALADGDSTHIEIMSEDRFLDWIFHTKKQ